jgi:hypothetical protein
LAELDPRRRDLLDAAIAAINSDEPLRQRILRIAEILTRAHMSLMTMPLPPRYGTPAGRERDVVA